MMARSHCAPTFARIYSTSGMQQENVLIDLSISVPFTSKRITGVVDDPLFGLFVIMVAVRTLRCVVQVPRCRLGQTQLHKSFENGPRPSIHVINTVKVMSYAISQSTSE